MINPDILPQVAGLLAALCVLLLVVAARANGRAMRAEHDAEAQAERAAASEAAMQAAMRTAERDQAGLERRLEIAEFQAERDQRDLEDAQREAARQRDLRVSAEEQVSALRERLAASRKELDLSAQHQKETLERVGDMRETMEARFRELSESSVKAQGEQLSKLNTERLGALLTPLKDHIGRFETELRGVHQKADKERGLLQQEIGRLTERSRQLSEDAQSLTKALRGDSQKQGAWGEMVLARLLESSGLIEGTHYVTQASVTTEEGRRLRPDVVVKLPEDRSLVIDSKVSLVAYERALAAEDPAEAAPAFADHVLSIRRHIDGLSSKAYQSLDGTLPDYVILFVPIEGALSDALRSADELTTYALERNVTIATPTTLMMALRTIHHVWQVDTRNRNAEEIAEEAGRLYDKLAGFTENMERVGKSLGQAMQAHENAIGQLSRGRGNALAKAEKIKAMGAKATKPMAIAADADDAVEPLSIVKDAP